MTNNIEIVARKFRKDEKYQSVVDLLEEAKRKAKELGAPDEFEVKRRKKVSEEEKARIANLHLILDALYIDSNPDEPNLTEDITRQFNKKLGGILPDGTLIEDLLFPSLISLDSTAKSSLLKFNPRLKANYSRVMRSLARTFGSSFSGYRGTLADLRKASKESSIRSLREIGSKSEYFAQNAFKPITEDAIS